MTKGWMKIQTEKDLQTALQKMLNRILSDADPLSHAGRFASLANSWISARRLELEAGEWKEIKARLEMVEQAQAFDNRAQITDFKQDMKEVREMMKELA